MTSDRPTHPVGCVGRLGGQDAQQASSNVAHDASSKASEVAATARAEAGSVARHARDQAADVVGSARSQLRTQADEQARSLSQSLDELARQLSSMAKQNPEPDSQLSQLVGSAGNTLSDRARRLDQDGLDGVVDDVKRLSRNRPVAFLVGSVAIGFGIGRLAKHADLKQLADTAKNELGSDDTDERNASTSIGQMEHGALPTPGPAAVAVPGGAVGGLTTANEGFTHDDAIVNGSDPTQPQRPDLSLGDVIGKLGDDLSGLLTTQIEIAKLEVTQEVTKAAKGAGLLSSGALAGFVAVFMLSAATAWLIAIPLNAWLGFLIVGVAWAIAAVALSLVGKRRLSEVRKAPQTIEELQADRELVKSLP